MAGRWSIRLLSASSPANFRFEELPEGLELAARRLPYPSLDGGAVKRLRVSPGRAFLGAHAA